MEPWHVAIRPPKAVRVYVVAFSIAWCGFVLYAFTTAVTAGSPAAVIPLFMLGFGGVLAYRLFRLSAITTSSELIVRNYITTKRISREQIEGFRLGSPASMTTSIMVLLRDETLLGLDAASRPAFLPLGQRRQEEQLRQLAIWLAN